MNKRNNVAVPPRNARWTKNEQRSGEERKLSARVVKIPKAA
jgi:hypothetical protein